MGRTRDYLTIGELVENLQPAHTISKVRFLEDEGILQPERTAGGYRKFSSQDAARVDLVLRLQKEQFLPLAVIREKLKELDKGRVPDELRSMVTRPEAVALPFDAAETVPIEQVQSTMGLPVTFVRELASFGLVRVVKGDKGDELRSADIEIAHAAWDLRRFGVEARHLRMYVNAVEREAALFSQILTPTVRHKTPETRQKLVESVEELTRLSDALKRSLLKRAIRDTFEDVV
jgi:DNA-binding transcriptional MerR regulator